MTQSGAASKGPHCSWCAAAVAPNARTCPACGATLAPPDAIADLLIPGLTAVDPALQAYDAQPIRIPLASPSQAIAGEAIVGAITAGPIGLAALGGFAAVAANEYLAAKGRNAARAVDPESVGRPPDYVLQALDRQEKGEGGGPPQQPNGAGAPTQPDGTAGNSAAPTEPNS